MIVSADRLDDPIRSAVSTHSNLRPDIPAHPTYFYQRLQICLHAFGPVFFLIWFVLVVVNGLFSEGSYIEIFVAWNFLVT